MERTRSKDAPLSQSAVGVVSKAKLFDFSGKSEDFPPKIRKHSSQSRRLQPAHLWRLPPLQSPELVREEKEREGGTVGIIKNIPKILIGRRQGVYFRVCVSSTLTTLGDPPPVGQLRSLRPKGMYQLEMGGVGMCGEIHPSLASLSYGQLPGFVDQKVPWKMKRNTAFARKEPNTLHRAHPLEPLSLVRWQTLAPKWDFYCK